MKLLLDTQLILWAAGMPERLFDIRPQTPEQSAKRVALQRGQPWEITIRNSLGRDDFRVEPRLLRRGLLDNGYTGLPITASTR